MEIERTNLTQNQVLRLINVIDTNEEIESATQCVIKGTAIKKFEIKFTNGNEESFYPSDDMFDFIVDGIKLERDEN